MGIIPIDYMIAANKISTIWWLRGIFVSDQTQLY